MATSTMQKPKEETATTPPPAGSHEEATDTARVVGYAGGFGSLITRES